MKYQLLDDIKDEQRFEPLNKIRLVTFILISSISFYLSYFIEHTYPTYSWPYLSGLIYFVGLVAGAFIYDWSGRSVRVVYTGLFVIAIACLYCCLIMKKYYGFASLGYVCFLSLGT